MWHAHSNKVQMLPSQWNGAESCYPELAAFHKKESYECKQYCSGKKYCQIYIEYHRKNQPPTIFVNNGFGFGPLQMVLEPVTGCCEALVRVRLDPLHSRRVLKSWGWQWYITGQRGLFASNEFLLLQMVSEPNTKGRMDCEIPHQLERGTKHSL